jgi:hypothetical protein
MRCNNFETKIFFEVKKHCLRIRPCCKRTDIKLSNDQLLLLSLIPYYDNEHSISINELEYLSNSDIIYQNKKELFNELDNIFKNKIKLCKYCNEKFDTIYELRKHITIKCFYNELQKKYNNIKKHNIIPFEEEWNISEISKIVKNDIMISQYVFSRFLTEILNNDKNSNVIIDKYNKSGKVYINHKEQYIEMTLNDILMKTMEKLYDQLYKIIENNKDSLKLVK